MADLACNVAERALHLQSPKFSIPEQISQMAKQTKSMVGDALNAFVNLDIALAFQVIAQDEIVDKLNVDVIDTLTEQMQQQADWIPPALHCFSASRHLERIADHATNIAEDVIYMVNGVIVRHRHGDDQLRIEKT